MQCSFMQRRIWAIKDAAYNADDLLDEIATIALRGELEAEAKANGKQVAPGQFSVLNLRNKESMLKKIVERLNSLSNQRDLLNLSGLNIQPENVMHQFGVLERLHISNSCESLESLPLGIFTKLQYLYIKD